MKIFIILLCLILLPCSCVLIYLYWEDSGYMHFISYSDFQYELGDSIAKSIDYCADTNKMNTVCAYETKDRYYFNLSRTKFDYNDFEKPSVVFQDNIIKIMLVNTNIKSSSANASYVRFYINKSDFPDAKGVVLDYSLYDKDWKLLEHKEEELTFPNFDLKLSYPK